MNNLPLEPCMGSGGRSAAHALVARLSQPIREALFSPIDPIAMTTHVDQDELLSLLDREESDLLQWRACRLLVEVGTLDALQALERILARRDASAPVATLAHCVISHRHGRVSEFLPMPAAASGELPARRTSVLRTGGGAVDLARALSEQGVRPHSSKDNPADFTLVCGGSTVAYAHAAARDTDVWATMRTTPLLAGRLFLQSPFRPRWVVHGYVVAGPLEQERAYVTVMRTNGAPWMTGVVAGTDNACRLRALAAPGGRPMQVFCHGHAGSLAVTGFSGPPADRRMALPFERGRKIRDC